LIIVADYRAVAWLIAASIKAPISRLACFPSDRTTRRQGDNTPFGSLSCGRQQQRDAQFKCNKSAAKHGNIENFIN
jgi:hypothetical protein